MKIGIDIDEVIVEFTKPFLGFYNKRNGTRWKYEDMRTYNLWECLGISKENALREADEFYKTKGFENGCFVPGALEGVGRLAERHAVLAITSRPLHIKEKTERFFGLYFPEVPVLFSGDFLNKNMRGKAEICSDLGIEYFIEDNFNFATEIAGKGIDVLLLDKPWNQKNCNGITRVKNWGEIMGILGGERRK